MALHNAPLPESVFDPKTGPLTKAFGPTFVAFVDQANKIIAQFQAVRDAKTKVKSALETSDAPEAIAYRETKAKVESKLEAIKADEKYAADRALIAELTAKINDDIKARATKVREIERTAYDTAVAAVVGAVVSDIDPETLATELEEINTQITGAKNMLLAENAGLKGWRPVSKSAASGTTVSAGGGFKPRLSFGAVNGTPVAASNGKNVTSQDIANAAGIKDVHHLTAGMLNAIGGVKEALRTDGEPHSFSIEVNGVPVTIEFLGRAATPKGAKIETVETETEDVAVVETEALAFSG